MSDTVPQQAVGAVVGIGGMAGSAAGIGFAQVVSHVLEFTGNNDLGSFALAASACLIALAVIHALLPQLQPMALAAAPAPPGAPAA